MSGDNPYREPQTEAAQESPPVETKPKTPLVVLGFGAWVSGFMVTRVAYSLMGDGMTPMSRGLLLGGSIVQVTGSAILLFCLVRFIYRKVTGTS